ERAKWFISELRHFSFLFHEQNPFEIISEIDPRTGENVFRVLVKESVPPQVSAIVGDTVHNLRSALDYLIGELALDNGEAPSENFGFPISRRAHRHVQSRRAQKLKGISPRAERLILWLKANERVNAMLWKLNWLDLIDKHNSILLTAASTVQVSAKVGVPGLFVGPDQTLRIAGPGIDGIRLMVDAGTPAKFKRVFPLKDNDEVYRSPAGFVEEVSGTIDIAIGGEEIPEGAPAVELLTQFVDLVERILGIFERQVLQKR
ncbi:MAG TPA: hypothetical protein VL918_12550, partial [Sphingobium sp.]|nr:hypothetical protein [Sphingobium sp.]